MTDRLTVPRTTDTSARWQDDAVRPKPGGSVSTPLDWSEVQDSLDVRALNLRTLPHRLAGLGRDPLLAIFDESPFLAEPPAR